MSSRAGALGRSIPLDIPIAALECSMMESGSSEKPYKTMTLAEQAEKIWPILIIYAKQQELLSYTTLAYLTGIPAHLQAKPLGRVLRYCLNQKYPPLTALVVNLAEGIPGELYPGNDPYKEQCQVFVFDWFKFDRIPTSTDFTQD